MLKHPLHLWNEVNLIMINDLSSVILNSVCLLLRIFYVSIHERDKSVTSLCFFCHVFPWFKCQSNKSFIKRIWKDFFLSYLINELSSILQVFIDDFTMNQCGPFLDGKHFIIGQLYCFIGLFNLFNSLDTWYMFIRNLSICLTFLKLVECVTFKVHSYDF